jgi:hypothetical protein
MSIRGVMGCYIYSLSKGIETRRGYPEGEELRDVSKELMQMFDASGANNNKLKTLRISYDKGEITMNRASNHLIVVFHGPKIDLPLLRIIVNVASYNLRKSERR